MIINEFPENEKLDHFKNVKLIFYFYTFIKQIFQNYEAMISGMLQTYKLNKFQ